MLRLSLIRMCTWWWVYQSGCVRLNLAQQSRVCVSVCDDKSVASCTGWKATAITWQHVLCVCDKQSTWSCTGWVAHTSLLALHLMPLAGLVVCKLKCKLPRLSWHSEIYRFASVNMCSLVHDNHCLSCRGSQLFSNVYKLWTHQQMRVTCSVLMLLQYVSCCCPGAAEAVSAAAKVQNTYTHLLSAHLGGYLRSLWSLA